MSPPGVSVVVASSQDLDLLALALSALRGQCDRAGAELIVARAESEPAEQLARVATDCTCAIEPAGSALPIVRSAGLARASGEWVLLTEDSCVADDRWIATLMGGAQAGVDVIGGSVGQVPGRRLRDRGAYYAEYGIYGGHRRTASVPPIAAASVAYRRTVLPEVTERFRAGLWENIVHERLYEAGRVIRVLPEARVRQQAKVRTGAFCRDRLLHGLDFAVARARTMSRWRALALLVVAPLIPPLLAARIAGALPAEDRLEFWRTVPATLLFLSAWAAGEALGYAKRAVAR